MAVGLPIRIGGGSEYRPVISMPALSQIDVSVLRTNLGEAWGAGLERGLRLGEKIADPILKAIEYNSPEAQRERELKEAETQERLDTLRELGPATREQKLAEFEEGKQLRTLRRAAIDEAMREQAARGESDIPERRVDLERRKMEEENAKIDENIRQRRIALDSADLVDQAQRKKLENEIADLENKKKTIGIQKTALSEVESGASEPRSYSDKPPEFVITPKGEWHENPEFKLWFAEKLAQAKKPKEDTKQAAGFEYEAEGSRRIIQAVDDLIGRVGQSTAGVGVLTVKIPGSPARNFAADLDTLKAGIGFRELTAMRNASKTGGALGQVSERELALLTSVLGALDQGQSPSNLKKNLEKVRESVIRWQEKASQLSGGKIKAENAVDYFLGQKSSESPAMDIQVKTADEARKAWENNPDAIIVIGGQRLTNPKKKSK